MSTSQSHSAPQAPQPTFSPTPMAEASHSHPSPQPTTANTYTHTHDAVTPAPEPVAPSSAPTAPPTTIPHTSSTDAPLSFNERLNAGDRYWKFKFALLIVLILTGLIGIGCFGWIIASIPREGSSYNGFDSYWSLWPSLVTWSISVIWCVVCILIFVLRKKTVHPGVRVTMDLLLWLGFIVTALFSVVALLDIMSWGTYGDLGYGYSSRGNYELQSNGTWVWEQDSDYISYPRDCNSTSNYYYSYNFASCADQDAYINKMWKEKPHRVNVELTGVVCQFFGLLLHFVLFVWACVDTHHYNRTKISKDAEKLAAGIVQTMINNGAVVPPPGQAYMRPQMGQGMYYQLPPHQQHGYPMTNMYPQQYQQMAPGPHPVGSSGGGGLVGNAIAGPSNEKGQGPRYA